VLEPFLRTNFILEEGIKISTNRLPKRVNLQLTETDVADYHLHNKKLQKEVKSLLMCLHTIFSHNIKTVAWAQKSKDFKELTHVTLIDFVVVPLHYYLL
jgi:hypothetical protein